MAVPAKTPRVAQTPVIPFVVQLALPVSQINYAKVSQMLGPPIHGGLGAGAVPMRLVSCTIQRNLLSRLLLTRSREQ